MEKKSRAYYNRLLSQYIDGTISEEDRFELEKHALDDPFLFEALEGLQNKDGNNVDAIHDLKSKVDQHPDKKRTRSIPLFNYGIAASLILLMGVGLWMFNTSNTASDTIAMNTSASEVEDKAFNIEHTKTELPIAESTKRKNKTTELSANNQYDSPKAVISQADNKEDDQRRYADEKILESRVQEEQPISSILQGRPAAVSPELSNVAETNSGSDVSDVISEALEEEKEPPVSNELVIATPSIPKESDESKEVIASDQVLNEEYTDKIQYSKKRSNSATSKANTQELRLALSEYIVTLDETVLAAPPNGISDFRANFIAGNNPTRLAQNIDKQIVVEFMLTSAGKPTNLKSLSDNDSECVETVIEAIKKSGTWITYPESFPAVVRLEMPCL